MFANAAEPHPPTTNNAQANEKGKGNANAQANGKGKGKGKGKGQAQDQGNPNRCVGLSQQVLDQGLGAGTEPRQVMNQIGAATRVMAMLQERPHRLRPIQVQERDRRLCL